MSNKVSRNSLRKRISRSIRELMIGEDDVSYWLARIDEVIDGFKEIKEEEGNTDVSDNILVMKVIRRIEYEDEATKLEQEAEKGKTEETIKRVKRVSSLTLEVGVRPIVTEALILAFMVIHGKLSMLAAIAILLICVITVFTTVLIMDIKFGALDR